MAVAVATTWPSAVPIAGVIGPAVAGGAGTAPSTYWASTVPIGSTVAGGADDVAPSATGAPTAATLGRGDALSSRLASQTAGSATTVSALAITSRRRSRSSSLRGRSLSWAPDSGAGRT